MGPRIIAGYFGPAERRRLGWLHRPAVSIVPRTTGIVVCAPLGFDALCAHRGLRHFAAAGAAAGFPTLRFDYDGTGDSAGASDDAHRWSSWCASIADAIAALQEATGVERVVLLGLGLGATLAASVAVEHEAVDGLVAIAPVVRGKDWLREARALKALMARTPAPAALALPDGSDELGGMFISEETRADLERVDLGSLPAKPGLAWLVIERDDRASSTRWIDALRAQGAEVAQSRLPGYAEMMRDPHESEVPAEMVARVVEWLDDAFAERCAQLSPRGGLSTGPSVVARDVEEFPVTFSDDRSLFGVVTRAIGSSPKRAVLLLTAGSNHHIGHGRMYVDYARRLAARGWLVLRYDVSGIGESAPHAECPENEVYSEKGVDDLRDAVAFVRTTFGVDHVRGAGLCSGAYNVLRGAEAGIALDRIVVINPLTFRWHEGESLANPPFMMAETAARYSSAVFMPGKWVKVLRGGVDLRHAAHVVADRLGERGKFVVREVRRSMGVPVADDLGTRLETLVERGVGVSFIFSVGDPGESILRRSAGRPFTQLLEEGRIEIGHLPDCDHSLSLGWMRELLWRELARMLDA